jgi:hypothetical protein
LRKDFEKTLAFHLNILYIYTNLKQSGKMKRIITLLALASMVACSVKEWKIKIIADMPATDKHAIQYAILDFNPKEKFIKEFYSGYLRETLKAAKTEERKNLQITSAITVNWDLLFKTVTANKLYLLNEKDTNYYWATEGKLNSHSKYVWLASKSFTIGGKPYCYVVPFVVSNGSNLSCKLDKSNLISLTEVYKEQIKF